MIPKKLLLQTYKNHSNELFIYLAKMITDQTVCEDILHDSFEKLITYSTTHEIDPLTIRAFLYKMVHNLAINHMRSKKQNHFSIDDSGEAPYIAENKSAADVLINAELSERIRSYLESLDPEGRSIFILHKDFGKTYEEISADIGISSRTVRRRMKGIIDNLAEILKKEGFL